MLMQLRNLTHGPFQRIVVESVLKVTFCATYHNNGSFCCFKYFHSHANTKCNSSSIGNKPSRDFDYKQEASVNEILTAQRNMARRMVLLDPQANTGPMEQKYDYLLVLDFEATCDNKAKLNPQVGCPEMGAIVFKLFWNPNIIYEELFVGCPKMGAIVFKLFWNPNIIYEELFEIIEFPVLKFNVRSQKVDAIFHQYVLPQYHPQLTPFCTELTGIVQDMVNGQPSLPEVLRNFDQWMINESLVGSEMTSAFITCGDWDLKTMLPKQCALLDIAPKPYFQRWINIKKSFADVTGTFPKGMMDMMVRFELKHKGRQHSGIDDCHNISSIVAAMLNRGCIFRENGRL